MNNKGLIATLLVLILLSVSMLAVADNPSIRPIYRTQEEWAETYELPEYRENKEITGNYDRTVAAECENGTFVGVRGDHGIVTWKGIPYGKIPARFERSVDPDPSDKVYEAFYYGKSVMQPVDKNKNELASLYEQGDLDCLTLAIYSGNSSRTDKPVLVYIHGGGWLQGGTVDHTYDGTNFVYYNPDMMVVDITYRVGVMGQINLGAKDENGNLILSDYTDHYRTSINNGLLDQIQALRWIKANIAAFGGDPDNVTICGESAGGGSVAMLTLIASDPENPYIGNDENLFGKVISMSGGFNQIIGLDKTVNLTKQIAEDLNAGTIEELQNVPFEELREWWNEPDNIAYLNFCVMDGNVLPLDPYETYSRCVGKNVITMQGATTNEFAYYRSVLAESLERCNLSFEELCGAIRNICTGNSILYGPDVGESFTEAYNAYMKSFGDISDTEKLLEFCNDYTLQGINYFMAEKQAKNGGTCYTYAFDQPYDGKYAYMGAGHAVDCFYLFGNFNGTLSLGNKEEVDFSIQFQRMIARFCTTGDPSTDGYEWKPYDVNDRNCMFLHVGDIRLIEKYNGDRIGNMVKMYDSGNVHFRFVDKWANFFMEAVMEKDR